MHNIKLSALSFPLIILLVGCLGKSASDQTRLENLYQISPTFREFYNQIGGLSNFGVAISPEFSQDRFKLQYVVAGLMIYDPQDVEGSQYSLAPLGREMDISQPAMKESAYESEPFINGFPIFGEFIPLSRKLAGEKFVSNPLTPPHYNPQKQRYEQYFEYFGLYRLIKDPPGAVHLLAYGVWKCGESCIHPHVVPDEVVLPKPIDKQFLPWVNKLGPDLTGYAITPAYTTADRLIQQVYDHLVLAIDPQQSERIILLPVPEKLGIFPEPIQPSTYNKNYAFFPIQGDLGYEIPLIFVDYINQHGGFEISGPPISHFKSNSEKVSRQCFQYYCLDEDQGVDGMLRIRPAPLGFLLSQSVNQKQPTQTIISANNIPVQETVTPNQATAVGSSNELSLQVWELYPLVNPQQNQEIVVNVNMNGVPEDKIEPYLTVYLPSNQKITRKMPPTDKNGQTSLVLDTIEAPNSTIIPYQVCIPFSNGSSYCARGQFLVWYSP